MTGNDKESEKERTWKALSEAGLIDIAPDEFAERIKEAKQVVMGRLSELLEHATDIQEREAAAYSLATLKEIERTVSRRGRRNSD
ncbi:MAG TPA: hypothetical protein VFL34_12060 [Candidatus Sulfotelmatobacter sp.]|nr:hypothetical protein [Candidatus Sulfotelmatobacter sp.]